MPTDPAAVERAEDEYADTPHAPEHAPVPVVVQGAVRVTEHRPRTVQSDQVPVSTSGPTRLVNEVRTRASVILAAVGGDVFVGGPDVTVGSGFKVAAGGSLTLETTAAVFAIAPAAGAVVHVLAQHRDG